MLRHILLALAATTIPAVTACDSCYGANDIVQTRNIRRMQPESKPAEFLPRAPLEWGQLNVLHTTDTHGWLEGHLKEVNYGADWGDFVSFTKHMKHNAKKHDVDLLLVDTGDLHDGNGLSDATTVNGNISNPVFENIDYDLLTIGNHELYVSEIAYETFNQFSKVYGERYLTSNVEIMNPTTKQFEYIGNKFRYFETEKGLKIMSFGVLYDFTGNSNASRITKAVALVQQQWFIDAVKSTQPIDLFLVLGHNPARPTVSGSTFGTIYKAIRSMRPETPVQFFGGHTHIRDFAVFPDGKATGMESGRYCETLGFFSVAGIPSKSYCGAPLPKGLPHPTQKAVPVKSNITNTSTTDLVYSRRYLDWNKATFEYHTYGNGSDKFDTHEGLKVTGDITADRKALNLSALYGCAPQTWCISCAPYGSNGSIFTLLKTALSATIINQTRSQNARMVIINTGSVRFDLAEGPFTYDDSFIVSPFTDAFEYLPNVPYSQASQILGILNGPTGSSDSKKRSISYSDFEFQTSNPSLASDSCVDPPITRNGLDKRAFPGGKVTRRQVVTPGYTTTDDFGTDGDDTVHSKIPSYSYPDYLQANASFPSGGTTPANVDLVFLDYIAPDVLASFRAIGVTTYTMADIAYYLPKTFTTNSYLPVYAKQAPTWQANVTNCPVGVGIGSS